MRLIYHPESDSLFLDDGSALADGLCIDVTEDSGYRSLAVLEDIDITQLDQISEEEYAAHDPNFVDRSPGGIAAAIAASMAKWARKPADLYPTPSDCTYSLLPYIEHLLPEGALLLEPACADGQMCEPLREFGFEVDGTDLRPDVTGGRGGIDFLDPHNYFPDDHYDCVITNPPFSAAEAFIRRALQIAPVVVMLVKAQYWNTKGRKKLFRETKPMMELNLTWRPAFLKQERGNSPLMDCMWVVWVRGHTGGCTVEMIDRLTKCPIRVGDHGL